MNRNLAIGFLGLCFVVGGIVRAEAQMGSAGGKVAFVDLHPGRVGNTIHDLPVRGYDELPQLREAFLLAAVGAPGARADVRARLVAAGFAEERDFLCVQ